MGFFAFVALVVSAVAVHRAGKAARAGEELVREVRGLRNQLVLERSHRNEDRARADARITALSEDLAALRARATLPAPSAAPEPEPAVEESGSVEAPASPTPETESLDVALPTEDATATVRREAPVERRGVDGPPVHEEPAAPEPDPVAPPAEVDSAAPVDPTEAPADAAAEAVAAPDAPPEAPPIPPAAPPRPRVNLEEWLGVKGAAVAGAVLVAFAGLLLFKVSIERGWFPPTLRVMSGVVAGSLCIGVAQLPRLRRYAITANALAGAGTVILFAAFWAARSLYDLIPVEFAFVLMGATTAACVALSMRHDSKLIATLGLVGGFATPLLLSTGSDNVIGLFGWILLLDLAFLHVARSRGWTWLAGLALLATMAYQGSWILLSMGPDRAALGVGILILFAGVFAAAGRGLPAEQSGPWSRAQAVALLFPLALGLYFAGHADIGENFAPTAAMLVLVALGSGFVSRGDPDRGMLQGAVAIGALPVVAVYLLQHGDTPGAVLQSSVLLVALAGAHHLAAELDVNPELPGGPRLAAAVAALGGGVVALGALLGLDGDLEPWPALLGVAGCAAFLLRQAMLPGRAASTPLAAALLGAGLAGPLLRPEPGAGFPSPLLWTTLMVALAAAFQGWARVPRVSETALAGHTAAALPPALLLALGLCPGLGDLPAAVVLGSSLALGAAGAFAATRIDRGWWYLASTFTAAFVHLVWGESGASFDDPGASQLGLGLAAVGVAFFSVWPLLVGPRFRDARPAWYGAALAGPFWFLAVQRHFEAVAGDGLGGVPAVLLAAVVVGVLTRARGQWPDGDPVRRSVVVWLAAVALFFVSAAVPLQLENAWLTIAWALEAWAVLVLWRRLDHAGLKYVAVALYAAVFVRLCFNPWVLEYAPRGGLRILNWLSYTYLVPLFAMLAGARELAGAEVERARPWEALSPGAARVAGLIVLGAVVVGFVWINLTVLDWFATTDRLSVDLAKLPARDLAMSLSWVAYALLLLVVGVAKRTSALRWVGLVLLLVTSVKVFLYDLSHLEDLYRVASIVGLGVSLIAVSLLYQRFVARGGGAATEDAS